MQIILQDHKTSLLLLSATLQCDSGTRVVSAITRQCVRPYICLSHAAILNKN